MGRWWDREKRSADKALAVRSNEQQLIGARGGKYTMTLLSLLMPVIPMGVSWGGELHGSMPLAGLTRATRIGTAPNRPHVTGPHFSRTKYTGKSLLAS